MQNTTRTFYEIDTKQHIPVSGILHLQWVTSDETWSTEDPYLDLDDFEQSDHITIFLADDTVHTYPTARACCIPETWEPLRDLAFPD